jgi:hypothetical protein
VDNDALTTEVDMSTLAEMTLEDAAKRAAGNWKSWTWFVCFRERENDLTNWAIVYTHNRERGCSGISSRSGLDASWTLWIKAVLTNVPSRLRNGMV